MKIQNEVIAGIAYTLAQKAVGTAEKHFRSTVDDGKGVSIFRFGDGWKAVRGTVSPEEARGELWASRPAHDPVGAYELMQLRDGEITSGESACRRERLVEDLCVELADILRAALSPVSGD